MCPGPRGGVDLGVEAGDLHEVAVRVRRDREPVRDSHTGTGNSRYSSPSDAFLPPTSGTSFKLISLNHRTNDMAFGTAHLSLPVGCACATPRTAARFVRGVAARGRVRVKFRGCRGISRSARIAVSGAREAAGGRVTARQISRTSGEAQCDCARLRWHCVAGGILDPAVREPLPPLAREGFGYLSSPAAFSKSSIARGRELKPSPRLSRRSGLATTSRLTIRSSRPSPPDEPLRAMCQGRPRADPSSTGTHRRSSGCSRS